MCNTRSETVCKKCGRCVKRSRQAVRCAEATGAGLALGACADGAQITAATATSDRPCQQCAAVARERARVAALQRASDRWHVCRGADHCLRGTACPKLRPGWTAAE